MSSAPAQYIFRMALPADKSDPEIALLGEAFSETLAMEEPLAFSAFREGNHKGPWVLEWITDKGPRPEESVLTDILTAKAQNCGISFPNPLKWQIEELPDQDWLAHSYRQFPPFSVGPFFIYGSHYKGTVPEEQIGLQIDAATAFGSGEHGTTKGCLQAMLDLKGKGHCPWNVLDMGTGSGILAIAAWKLWKTPVLAVDNDPECVRVSAHHCDINGVPMGNTEMTLRCGDGFKEETTQKRRPYDLIIANILAVTLREMAEDVRDLSDENGTIILSGILSEQATSVVDCYAAQGFALKNQIDIGEWTTLVMQNTRALPPPA